MSTRPLDQGKDRDLAVAATLLPDAVYATVGSSAAGLGDEEVAKRQATFGPNRVGREHRQSILSELWTRARNPLNGLLLALAVASYYLGDYRAAVVIAIMVVLAIVTSFVQEHRANRAAEALRAMVHTSAAVRRPGKGEGYTEIPVEQIVPGDVVRLSAGDMIPADLRLIESHDLYINQSALTGEAMPAEKDANPCASAEQDVLELRNLCFMGANVVSGYGCGLVLRTGPATLFGTLASDIAGQEPVTAFDRDIGKITWLMIRFILVMVPLVFVINGVTKHDWLEALLFAVAVGVGLTPEMLPMIVSVNLAKGAIAMSRVKVIVKRLSAIQNLGAMDVLCTDKTGTLTQDRIILKRHLDLAGNDSEKVLEFAYLNSHYQSGLTNLLDEAILAHVDLHKSLGPDSGITKLDELPFDFERRRMSVVVKRPDSVNMLICKGAVEEIFSVSTRYELGDETGDLDASHFAKAQAETVELNSDGFRVVAVAYSIVDAKPAYTLADEANLTLLGYIAFLDPPKDSAREAIAALGEKGIEVKVLTGDNDIVTRKICADVELKAGGLLLGRDIAKMSDAELDAKVDATNIFAKLTPSQKERIIRSLRRGGHVVGFLGDGINDSPALKAADVGVSVDTAVDIAKESADIILLEKSLMVLREGVVEGRRVFANVTKYIRMGLSSNFGNMLSVLGASIFLPFLPMAPIQVLTNNLLYDFSQASIPTDEVDADSLLTPRRWEIFGLFRYMVTIGPISSIFDYATFGMMIFILGGWTNPALFQTGWFVESLISQTLIIHILRTAKIPFLESRASSALVATTLIVCVVGISLPFTGLGAVIGFVPLPWLYWPLLFVLIMAYAVLTQLVKAALVRRWGL